MNALTHMRRYAGKIGKNDREREGWKGFAHIKNAKSQRLRRKKPLKLS